MEKELSLPLNVGSFKGWIHPDYNYPPFIEAISDCQRLLKQRDSRILHEGRNRVGVVRLKNKNNENADVVIKEFKIQGVNKLKSLLLPSKALRAWKGAVSLLERRIDTPFPIACLERRKKGFVDQSYYLAEKVEEVKEIRYLFLNSPVSKIRPLVESLSRYLFVCHEKGILHRDLSDGNILVKEDKGKFRFYFIDTNRIRFPKRIRPLSRIKNLVRLGIPSQIQPLFLDKYLGSVPVKRSLWFWYKMNKIMYTSFVEFKKKLKLRELSHKLKIQ
ncbi:MAG: lipopolysaccharide kinase InaA family protein [Candidatus Aminicenantaceae bacterium]